MKNPSCFRISGSFSCGHCKGKLQKAGKQKNGAQKLFCRNCQTYSQAAYQNKACTPGTDSRIVAYLKEGVGIRGMARLLGASPTTILRRIKNIAARIPKPPIPLNKPALEVDEIKTFVRKKANQYWVAYVLCRCCKRVLDFIVGKRNKGTLRTLLHPLLQTEKTVFYTDRLPIYRYLIPKQQHSTFSKCTNHIERQHLTVRCHVKRLSRRTLCFSRSATMLQAVMKIYFWG